MRLLTTYITSLSVLLCAATCAVWKWSHQVAYAGRIDAPGRHWLYFETFPGVLEVDVGKNDYTSEGWYVRINRVDDERAESIVEVPMIYRYVSDGGTIMNGIYEGSTRLYYARTLQLRIRTLVVASVLPVLLRVGVAVRGRRRARRRAAAGRCVSCGYDLRGLSSGRCPECGRSVTTAWPIAATDKPG